jgi:hypothetical protein
MGEGGKKKRERDHQRKNYSCLTMMYQVLNTKLTYFAHFLMVVKQHFTLSKTLSI